MAAKFEIRSPKTGEFRWVLTSQGRTLATSEAYTRKVSCVNAIESVRKAAPTATLADMTAGPTTAPQKAARATGRALGKVAAKTKAVVAAPAKAPAKTPAKTAAKKPAKAPAKKAAATRKRTPRSS
ncbi:MAG TPA: DUF1508 domain-containing protein [Acidimicrobiia bacterium]|nr:DUF1508 domain-containing protein [Acidimicrobiia bacterium]